MKDSSIKYLFVTGGVASSLGKGLALSSLAMLLESRGVSVGLLKLDPYLNVDPGTMSPLQHGEVYVTDDGAETDLDLGHYFRYSKSPLGSFSNATAGQVYETVLKQERAGKFLGNTVQIVPHITNEIQHRILRIQKHMPEVDIVIVEVGGTVGDIESLPFLEAIRQFKQAHPGRCINMHLTYVPYLPAAKELKTKPTQHSVQALRAIGIIPDLLLCRSEQFLAEGLRKKIALFCGVSFDNVFCSPDVDSIYALPMGFFEQKMDLAICNLLGVEYQKEELDEWKQMLKRASAAKETIQVGIVGKYLENTDCYKSVFEALTHASIHLRVNLKTVLVESDSLHCVSDVEKACFSCDAILVPGGFGARGWEGKIAAATYCREKGVPYFGICLGMQVLCVEFARHVLQTTEANSTEMNSKTPHPIVDLLPSQIGIKVMGGSMRLGAQSCILTEESLAFSAYKSSVISERHRHRYEFNNEYRDVLQRAGMRISGRHAECDLCEIVEMEDHPWMLGAQFHPEFKSRPVEPHPLFVSFLKAAMGRKGVAMEDREAYESYASR